MWSNAQSTRRPAIVAPREIPPAPQNASPSVYRRLDKVSSCAAAADARRELVIQNGSAVDSSETLCSEIFDLGKSSSNMTDGDRKRALPMVESLEFGDGGADELYNWLCPLKTRCLFEAGVAIFEPLE